MQGNVSVVEFEWDVDKDASNRSKHGVSFIEASTAFADSLARIIADPDHSTGEERFLLLGMASAAKLLVVSYTVRGESIRIISAREATPAERRSYANQS